MKLICLDTETTGFSSKFDRIIEIGCICLDSNKTFQKYINPNRSVNESAVKIHGLTKKFLSDFDLFESCIEEFLAFIKGATLIIHNANFDMNFLNAELERNNYPPLENEVIDTLVLAKKELPGKKVNLDALQKHYEINIERTNHGALLDAQILAKIYIEMQKKQTKLEIKQKVDTKSNLNIQKILIEIDETEEQKHKNIFAK